MLLNIGICQQLLAQITDDFSDGEFTTNPTWVGTTARFAVSAQALKLQAPPESGVSWLATSSRSINDATWEFFVRMDFNPSSTNFVRVYLVSDNADLTNPLEGYYVMLGNTADEISLYRQSGSTRVEIIDGLDGRLNLASVQANVKVTRDSEGNWQLYSDAGITGSYTSEGTVNDLSVLSSSYFGVYCEYTSTRSDKIFFDNIRVEGNPFTDTVPPVVTAMAVLSSTSLRIDFSEEIDRVSALSPVNYSLKSTGAIPDSVIVVDTLARVDLVFSPPFANGISDTLLIRNVSDTTGNVILPTPIPFLYFQEQPVEFRDVIITEILADFDPALGLPAGEFVEIYNRSENPVQLEDWMLTDGTSTGRLGSFILSPRSYAILCGTSLVTEFQAFGSVIGVSGMPTLNNNADALSLVSDDSVYLDSLRYSSSWYRNEDKNSGGWSLEIIDPDNFCLADLNWTASNAAAGGTPGSENSVFSVVGDLQGPRILEVREVDSLSLTIIFNEPLDTAPPGDDQITLSPAREVVDVKFEDAGLSSIRVSLGQPVDPDRMYTISVSDIRDCSGNAIDPFFSNAILNLDTIPPVIDSVVVASARKLEIYFSEEIQNDERTGENFFLPGNDVQAVEYDPMLRKLTMTFNGEFANGVEQKLTIHSVSDVDFNSSKDIEVTFLYFVASPVAFGDIVINEIFADPSPVVGLPASEFVELYNRSEYPVSLESWRFTDRSSTAIISNRILLPGQYVVIVPATALSLFDSVDNAIGLTNFPTLNNTAETLLLIDANGRVIDSLVYSYEYYHDTDKQEGGWSLERIDPDDVCRGSMNWSASIDERGGTPGVRNSVFDVIVDVDGPRLINASQTSQLTVSLEFDESVFQTESFSLAFEPSVQIQTAAFLAERFIDVQVADTIDAGRTYRVVVAGVRDCPGNEIAAEHASAFINLDTIPPFVTGLQVVSAAKVTITFSEKVARADALSTERFQIVNPPQQPVSAVAGEDGSTITLEFPNAFENGVMLRLKVDSIADINGNRSNLLVDFFYFEPLPTAFKDIVFTEIMADPAPSAGLPESEYLEIYNRSRNPVDIGAWTLSDETTIATVPSTIILPGEYFILCSTGARESLSGYGKAIGVAGFPSLNNTGESLVLRNTDGRIVDSVFYSPDFFKSDGSMDGGVSLELIDPDNLCAESENWTDSENASGGTPGAENSVNAEMIDITGPRVVTAFAEANGSIFLTFDEKLDGTVPARESFGILPLVKIEGVEFVDRSKRSVRLLATGLEHRVRYELTVSGVYDCAGNLLHGGTQSVHFAVPEEAVSGDIVINEVLFNPWPNGADFVEILNRSEKFINLRNWNLANFADSVWNQERITPGDHVLAPGEYLCLTPRPEDVLTFYPRAKIATLFGVKSLPPLPDDEGSVALINSGGQRIDSLVYSREMHSPLIRDDEGVSLERISASDASGLWANWRSASSQSGFATPGYQNSNAIDRASSEHSVYVEPEVFLPGSENAGFATINFNFDRGGFVANVIIFDSNGAPVRTIANNETLGVDGFFRWDGDDDSGRRARAGYYMVWVEVFNDRGELMTFRKKVAVAGRF